MAMEMFENYRFLLVLIIINFFQIVQITAEFMGMAVLEGVCPLPRKTQSVTRSSCFTTKYVLYDVNYQEGFNLRRDVYIRLAVWMNKMQNAGNPWKLVLPPWGKLYHWKLDDINLSLPWGTFFHVQSMQNYAPVVEISNFFKENGHRPIDNVIILQHYKNSWSEEFRWKDNWDVDDCSKPYQYRKTENGLYVGTFLGMNNITANEITCVSFHGSASLLEEVVIYFGKKSILFEHAEIVLHDHFGDTEYWECRKSMKFSKDLVNLSKNYIRDELNLTDTDLNDYSAINKDKNFKGYPYVCSHLRRNDYLLAYPKEVPDLKSASEQLMVYLKKNELTTLFIATDASDEEFYELKSYLPSYAVMKYFPTDEVKRIYKMGGVAIIEQIICSYSRFFVGSYQSTYSFRIQEEREILKFDPATTFNRLCGANTTECNQPTRWLMIEY